MRVLHLASVMGIGGAEALVLEMVRRGHEVGWESAVASGGGLRADLLAAEGFQTFDVPPAERSVSGLARARAAASAAVSAFRPDVVIAHNVSATAVARLARPALPAFVPLPRRGVPVVTVFHGVGEADYRGAARVLTLTTDHVVVVADAIGRRLSGAGLRGVGTSVIRNAVTVPESVDRAAARAELELGDGPVALCLARMAEQKRHDILIDAWKLRDDGVLLLAGDGPLRADLERRAAPLGDRVRFLGARSDVPRLLAATDVTVLTSDWEGLPIAVLESLAAGRPVVATDVDGLREVLGGGGGRLVPPRDPDAAARALGELLDDPAARAAEAEAGLATIRTAYDPGAMMRSYDDLIRRICTR
ncbi:glycosyltransferase [Tsukamurella sp. 8F]|uniref:glycosyltransferase n=1 Tax=unclassified Tsukamurella TaxID=2633480 RepID=UPI0023B960DB|nr:MULTISPECIES: glycosyltransferase [unclassified Tsukamurella]MDF0530678.1 glycosyltransferase [Tsukamurella sp. 8J]MDF0587879.1 glycosyltransferase [Tsukamurella sp. 8F]